MFFQAPQNTAPLFARGRIPVINHLGDADSQVDLARQQALLTQVQQPHLLSIQRHPGN